jgi:hypothetical protein
MQVEITSEEAQSIYYHADKSLRYLTGKFRWWFGTEEELRDEIARQALIVAKMEEVIRFCGDWEKHCERMATLRK